MQQQFNHDFEEEDSLQNQYTCQDSEFYKLYVDNSTIFESGKGLFAGRQIKKGQIILEYYGAIINSQFCNSQPFLMQDKMVYINNQYCVISRGPASRANDIVIWQPEKYNSYQYKLLKNKRQFKTHVNKHRNGTISLMEKNKAFLIATQIINKGEQIFIDYGFQYWDFFFQKQQQTKNSPIDNV